MGGLYLRNTTIWKVDLMDKLNEEWLHGNLNFYFQFKRELLESMIEGSCINIGCGSHEIRGAVNIDEGLPRLSFSDKAFDTVICSDVSVVQI